MTSLKEIFEVCDNKPIAFIIKGSPDPDAIASSLALLAYYRSIGGEGKIYHEDYVSHSSNKAMINILDIQLVSREKDTAIEEEYYVVCDHCDPYLPGINHSKCLLHIDHHKTDEKAENGHTSIIEYDAGSCSTIITRLLNDMDFFSLSANVSTVATALVYGIKTDTDNLDGAREKDWEAMKVLSQYKNKDELRKISNQKISVQAAEILKTAMANEKKEQGWLYSGVGFLQETYRDAIAQVADEFNRRQGADYILVYGIIEKAEGSVVEGSIRSTDAGFDVDSFARQFSSNAGGRKYKGGFQIPLDFWATCERRELLEELVKTCIEGKIVQILGTSTTTTKKKKKTGKDDD